MKTWKRVASMLMALTLTGSFAACDMGGGGSSDIPETTQTYTDAVNATLNETKSVKFSLTMDLSENPFDDTTGEVTMDFLFTDSNGSLAMTIDGVSTSNEGESSTDYMKMIMKDGYVYTKVYSNEYPQEKWDKAEAPIIPTDFSFLFEAPETGMEESAPGMMMVLQQIFATKEMKEIMAFCGEQYQAAWTALIESGTMENGVWTNTINLQPVVSDWIAYINAIDEETLTIAQALEGTFAKLGLVISCEQIINELSVLVSKTVPEAIDVLDAFAQENFNKSLQELKDTLLETELAGVILNMIAGGDTQSSVIQNIKDFQISSLKTNENVKNMTLKDLINMMIESAQPKPEETLPGEGTDGTVGEDGVMKTSNEGGEGSGEVVEESVDYVAQIIGMMTQMKDMTLAEAEIMIPEIPVTSVKTLSITNSLTLNANKTRIIGAAMNFAVEMNFNPMVSDQNTNSTGLMKLNVGFAVKEFSTSVATVNAPADSECNDMNSGNIEE